MDLARLGLIYLLVGVMAGGIAYLGNRLGRQIGRRKMSVLHLRPRHTSILITSLTGALIALVTLTLFAFMAEPVRTFLTGLERLRAEERELQGQVAELRQALAEGAIVWKVDERIVHVTLPAERDPERIRQAILGLLAEVNAKTILRNNRIAEGKGDPPLQADQVLVDYDADQLDVLARELTRLPDTMGVRVVSERNCLYKDRAPVRLEHWEVRRVFREGEEVARRRIDPQDPARLSQFFSFVEATRMEALRRGMQPVGGELGGGLTESQIGELERKIEQQPGDCELVAVANRDLYETNSLDVRIEVRPADLTGALPQ